jgi:hypothetical protein
MDSGSDSDYQYEDFDVDENIKMGDARLSTKFQQVDEALELIVFNPETKQYDLGEQAMRFIRSL